MKKIGIIGGNVDTTNNYTTNVYKTSELKVLSKPNSKAFEYIENTVKINPENILFIDDTQINIDEANKRKWKTCRADGFEFEKIKRSVEEFLEKGEINE